MKVETPKITSFSKLTFNFFLFARGVKKGKRKKKKKKKKANSHDGYRL
jgi:hypothetical protein